MKKILSITLLILLLGVCGQFVSTPNAGPPTAPSVIKRIQSTQTCPANAVCYETDTGVLVLSETPVLPAFTVDPTNTSVTAISVNAAGGADYTSIQDALDAVPSVITKTITITVADGDYSSEDLYIKGYWSPELLNAAGSRSAMTEGNEAGLKLVGNTTNPENVQIGSIYVTGTHQMQGPLVYGFEIQNVSPYNNDAAGVQAHGCKEVGFQYIAFDSTYTADSSGILIYNSTAKISHIDVTNTKYGIHVKRFGRAALDNLSGSCTYLFFSTAYGTITYDSSTITATYGSLLQTTQTDHGVLVDKTNGTIMNSFGVSVDAKTTSFAISGDDDFTNTITMDATGGNRTVTLPDSAIKKGRIIRVVRLDDTANTLVIGVVTDDVLNGTTDGTYSLSGEYDFVAFQSNADQWLVINE